MADGFSFDLLCAEKTDACFDGFDCNAIDESGVSSDWHDQDLKLNHNRSCSFMGFPLQSDERISVMVESERVHLPRDDYLKRFRSGDLDFSVRKMAIDWIWKRGRDWTVQLLAVACLSIAAKIEELKVPLLVDLQVGQPEFVFEGKTVQRMELLVLNTLKWKMHAFTPCSFIDYFLGKISNNQKTQTSFISKSLRLILSTLRGVPFLEFNPSEIAAAVAIHVAGEFQNVIRPQLAKTYFMHVEKPKVLKCFKIIQDLLLISVLLIWVVHHLHLCPQVQTGCWMLLDV